MPLSLFEEARRQPEDQPLRSGSEEYLDSEKYQLKPRDFCAPGNLNADIARLNRIRRAQPALQRYQMHRGAPDQHLCRSRSDAARGRNDATVTGLARLFIGKRSS